MRQRIRLVNLKLGDPDDVEIYAGAACYEWMQTDHFAQLKKYGINEKELFWTNGVMDHNTYSVTVDIWAEVEPETMILLKLAGLTSLK